MITKIIDTKAMRYSATMPKNLMARLDQRAKALRRKRSSVLNELVEKYCHTIV